jgi:hypothetical protein
MGIVMLGNALGCVYVDYVVQRYLVVDPTLHGDALRPPQKVDLPSQ